MKNKIAILAIATLTAVAALADPPVLPPLTVVPATNIVTVKQTVKPVVLSAPQLDALLAQMAADGMTSTPALSSTNVAALNIRRAGTNYLVTFNLK